jgi:hypothetical protein
MRAVLKYVPAHGLLVTLSEDGKPERSRLNIKAELGKDVGLAKSAAFAALALAGYSVGG